MGVITRPKAWPSFKGQSNQIMRKLSGLEWWKLVMEEQIINRGTFLVAQSVTKEKSVGDRV